KVLHCERQRVEESVIGLGIPLAEKVVRQVTIVAHGHMSMAARYPRVEVTLHHMAVRAPFGPIAQITRPLAVAEREGADSGEQSQQHGEQDGAGPEPGTTGGLGSG